MDHVGEEIQKGGSAARVYLLVDSTMIRAGLENVLGRGRFEVAGACSDPTVALEDLRRGIADIVLVDLRHPQSDGFHWAVKLRKELDGVRILVVRENPAPDQVTLALRSGVDSVICPGGELSELFIALDSLYRGYTYLSPCLIPMVTASHGGLPQEFADRSVQLSEHEIEIVRLLALGRTANEIAARCETPEEEVEEIVVEVGRKLGCHSAADFTRLAIREGYLPR